jgi:hypothetical protein
MSVANLKYIVEHRDEYEVGFARDLDAAADGVIFPVTTEAGTEHGARQKYVETYHINPFDLDIVALEKVFLQHKALKARADMIDKTMASHVVEHLVERGDITESESEHVKVSDGNTKRALPPVFAEHRKALGMDSFAWAQDVQDVIGQVEEQIRTLVDKLNVYKKLQKIDWDAVRVEIRDECTKAVDEYLAKDEDE